MARHDIKVELNQLEVNVNNFRHSPVSTEVEAIKKNISENIDSFIDLMRSMTEDLHTFTFILKEKDGKFVVMDGNRRLSVFKLFKDCSFLSGDVKYSEVINFVENSKLSTPEYVNADIYSSSESDDIQLVKRLEMIHVQLDPLKIKWSPVSQFRASTEMSFVKHPWIKILLNYYDDSYVEEVTKDRTDAFNRFLYRKDQLKIDEHGRINLDNDKLIVDEIVKLVCTQEYTMSSDGKNITADTRTSKQERDSIINDIIARFSFRPVNHQINIFDESFSENPNPDSTKTSNVEDVTTIEDTPRVERPKINRRKRATGVYLLHKLNISSQSKIDGDQKVAIENILLELKRMNSNGNYINFQLSTFFLVRALLEQLLKYWLATHHSSLLYKITKGTNGKDPELSKLIAQITKTISNNFTVFSPGIDISFKLLFGNDNVLFKDRLDKMIHQPHLLNRYNTDVIHSYTSSQLFSIFQFILTADGPEKS